MKCLKCGKEISLLVICDNDCGTIICDKCYANHYVDSKGILVKGHHPKCGVVDYKINNSEIIDWKN